MTTDQRGEGAAPPWDGDAGPSAEDAGELLVRAREGDGAAWARLVERYSRLLWSVARSYGLGEADAGDAVQTTWLRLVERIDRIEQPGAVGRWLVVTVRRESLRTARRSARQGAVADADALPAPGAAAPEDLALVRERVGQVATVLQGMPGRCRRLLRLIALAPSYAEVAVALDIPVGSIGPTRARCLDDLRRRLA